MADFDVEAIRVQIRAMDFVRGSPEEVADWRIAGENSRHNLVIEDMIPTANEDAFFDMMLDEGVSPPLMIRILLRLLDHPNADHSLPITAIVVRWWLDRSLAGVARTFMSNASIVQTFGVNDRATAYMLSKTIGDTTIEYETVGTSRGLGWGENRAGRSESTNAHVSARRLATPDEIMRMQSDQLLLLRQGERPLVVEKIRYYNQCEFAGLFDPGWTAH